MTTILQATEAVYQHFTDEWDDETPVAYEDQPFTEPSEPYVKLIVSHLASEQDTLGGEGNRVFRRRIGIICEVYYPAGGAEGDTNVGRKGIDTLVAAIMAIWEGQSFSGITVVGGVQPTEIVSEGAWRQTNVEAFADYYEVR